MDRIVLRNADLVLPDRLARNTSLLIENGAIARITDKYLYDGDEFDLGGKIVYPGFIDIHNHGAMGVDVNTASAGDLEKVGDFLAANGVTAWMPTLVPDSDENYRKVIQALNDLMETQGSRASAQAVGVHYEGVFANEKMCGALRPQYFKKFTGKEIKEIPRLKDGCHFTTLAPEVEGGRDLIRELALQGWIVSLGHTKADVETLHMAFESGARHLTHFYNAMTGLHHRDLGVVGWAFANEKMTFDIIADGIHVHPEMLKFACLSKGADSVSLISDSVLPTGLGDGEFEVWGERISVENGRTQNERGSIAGSVITIRDAVKRMLSLGFVPPEVSKMASLNPARLLRIDDTHGSIEVGKRADLVAFDTEGRVAMVMVGGRMASISQL